MRYIFIFLFLFSCGSNQEYNHGGGTYRIKSMSDTGISYNWIKGLFGTGTLAGATEQAKKYCASYDKKAKLVIFRPGRVYDDHYASFSCYKGK